MELDYTRFIGSIIDLGKNSKDRMCGVEKNQIKILKLNAEMAASPLDSIPEMAIEKIAAHAEKRFLEGTMNPHDFLNFAEGMQRISNTIKTNPKIEAIAKRELTMYMEKEEWEFIEKEAESPPKAIKLAAAPALEIKDYQPEHRGFPAAILKKAQQLSALETGITPDEMLTLCNVIETNKALWLEQLKKEGGDAMYISHKAFSGLPRSIIVYRTGEIEIMLGRKKIHELGHGSFSAVTYSLGYNSAELLAHNTSKISQDPKDKFLDRKLAKTEIDTLMKCRGAKHIIQIRQWIFYQTRKKPKVSSIVERGKDPQTIMTEKRGFSTEICNMGSLRRLLLTLNPREVYQVTSGILKGMIEVRKLAGVIHHDLKPENILLHWEADGTITAKIGDFGAASRRGFFSSDSGLATKLYESPERILETEVGFPSDIWSLGMVFIELLGNQNIKVTFEKVKNALEKYDPSYRTVLISTLGIGSFLSGLKEPPFVNPIPKNRLGQLIERMLIYRPHERISYEEALTLIEELQSKGQFERELLELRAALAWKTR